MEFTVRGQLYRTGRLNAFKQLFISKRIVPAVGKLAGLTKGAVKLGKDADGNPQLDGDLEDVLTPLVDAIASLKDEDVEYILNACLEAAERKQSGGAWARVRVNGTTMFDDLNLPALLKISYHVIWENLQDFFSDLPSISGLKEAVHKLMESNG